MHALPLVHGGGPGQMAAPMHASVPPQLVSHWHEALQSILPAQLVGPPQLTVQRPGPQVVAPAHELAPPQVMAQLVAALQSMPPLHAAVPAQSTMHGIPAGQTTAAAQLFA